MDAQAVFIHHPTGAVRAGVTSSAVPDLVLLQRAELNIDLAFFDAEGTVIALDDAATGRLVIKSERLPKGTAWVLDTAWTASGADEERRYTFSAVCDSAPLRTALANRDCIAGTAQVEWQLPDETEPRLSYPFPVTIKNAYSLGDDDAIPDPAGDAAQELLDASTVRYAPAVTGLTGGGEENLDGQVTFDVPVRKRLEIVIDEEIQDWILLPWVDETEDASGGIVIPDDFDADDNAKFWKRLR